VPPAGVWAKVWHMKRAVIILGIVLLILGLAAVLHPTYTYHKQEQVAKIGAFQATADEERTAQVPPLAVATVIVSGLALVLIGSRKKA
jgi:Ni/Fe-hydrogenase subunit HybB-like protein